MRWLLMVLISGCASAPPPAPASPPPAEAPEGSYVELLRQLGTPGSIAELDGDIRQLVDLASRSDDPAPLLLRLAEAFQARAAAHGRAEAVALEERFERRGDDDAEAAAQATASEHAEARVADLVWARRVLESIEPSSPSFVDAQEARFWLLAERREWEEESLEAARTLLDGSAREPMRAAAHLRLAEHAFLEADLENALERYDQVLATAGADAQTRAYASYKRAWVLYNLSRFEDADRAFADVIALAGESAGGPQLIREAAKDRIRVHVALESSPERVLAVITESTEDAELRASLATRYEQMLRDSGQLAAADAFRAALLR